MLLLRGLTIMLEINNDTIEGRYTNQLLAKPYCTCPHMDIDMAVVVVVAQKQLGMRTLGSYDL